MSKYDRLYGILQINQPDPIKIKIPIKQLKVIQLQTKSPVLHCSIALVRCILYIKFICSGIVTFHFTKQRRFDQNKAWALLLQHTGNPGHDTDHRVDKPGGGRGRFLVLLVTCLKLLSTLLFPICATRWRQHSITSKLLSGIYVKGSPYQRGPRFSWVNGFSLTLFQKKIWVHILQLGY